VRSVKRCEFRLEQFAGVGLEVGERAAIDRLIVAYAGPDPQSMARIATADRIELVTLATGPKLQNRFLRATQ
jgi:hypothetical protein